MYCIACDSLYSNAQFQCTTYYYCSCIISSFFLFLLVYCFIFIVTYQKVLRNRDVPKTIAQSRRTKNYCTTATYQKLLRNRDVPNFRFSHHPDERGFASLASIICIHTYTLQVVARFMNNSIIIACTLLLTTITINCPHGNHCYSEILKYSPSK